MIAAASMLLPSLAFGQGAVLQGGPVTAGHAPMYVQGGNGAQTVVQDSGPAGGGGRGLGLSELLLVKRGAGTPPFANGGTGPLGSSSCMYDAPTNNPTGYHYLCFDPNAQGGALIAVGAGGTATPLPFTININGTIVPFPGALLPNIIVGTTFVSGGTNGYFLTNNVGVVGNFNLFGTANTWTLQQTVTAPVSASLYKVGADTILIHPLTPSADHDPGTLIAAGKGAGALLAPIHSTEYLSLYGFNAGGALTTEDHMTCIGAWSCASYNSGGTQIGSTGIGIDSQRALLSGIQNTTVGEHTLTSPIVASFVTAMGYNASLNIGGTYGTFFGHSAGQGQVGAFTGQMNAGFGNHTLLQITGAASFNAAIGPFACSAVTTGSQNFCAAQNAGQTLTTGSRDILIGVGATTPAPSTNDFLNIGNVIFGTGINTVGLGSVGIGTQAPFTQFEVYGAGQTVAALTDAGVKTGMVAVNSSSTAGGAGGAVVFGNVQSEVAGSIGWASIKAFLTNGSGNVTGDLAFATRNAIGDTALTERMRILGTGNVNVLSSLAVQSGTAVPAGGTAGAGLLFSSTANLGVFFGVGVPTLAAAKGSIYLRTDGSSTSTRSYVNTDGGTTWTAITTASWLLRRDLVPGANDNRPAFIDVTRNVA